MKALQQKYSGSPTEITSRFLKGLSDNQERKLTEAKRAAELVEKEMFSVPVQKASPPVVTAVATAPEISSKTSATTDAPKYSSETAMNTSTKAVTANHAAPIAAETKVDGLNKLQSEYQKLNKELARNDIRQGVREVLEAKQKKIGNQIQGQGGAIPQESKAEKVTMVVNIDTQLPAVMKELNQLSIQPITTRWPAAVGKGLATLTFSTDDKNYNNVATKLAQVKNPPDPNKIQASKEFIKTYENSLQTALATREQTKPTDTTITTAKK